MTDTTLTGQKRAMLLNDLSCFGKCSLTVGLPILSAVGVEALALPTALLSTHTGGFTGYTCLALDEELEKILAHWRTLQLHTDAIATGYFGAPAQLALAKRLIADFAAPDTLVLVDPVMADGGQLYPGFDIAFVGEMRTLCGMAHIITPNLTEAFLLAGMPYTASPNEMQLRECLRRLLALGAKQVVITGVPCTQDLKKLPAQQLWGDAAAARIGYVCAAQDGDLFCVWHPFVHTALHGCGDVFSAAYLAASLGDAPDGRTPAASPFADAVTAAAAFTARCVQATDPVKYPGHWYGLRFESCLAEGFWRTCADMPGPSAGPAGTETAPV